MGVTAKRRACENETNIQFSRVLTAMIEWPKPVLEITREVEG
jgi:hypothetical protein